jgi:cytochrome c peroxidase
MVEAGRVALDGEDISTTRRWTCARATPIVAAVFRGIVVACAALMLATCRGGDAVAPAVQRFATPFSSAEAGGGDSVVAPLPQSLALDAHKVALGARLFQDRRVSGDGRVSCLDCHQLDRGGANGEARSRLPNRGPVAVNVPSIFNMAFEFRFGWNGRFEDIGEQLDAAMKSPAAMAGSWERAVDALRRDAVNVREFAALYPDGLQPSNLRDVLALYSLSLITPNSRFDRYLRGELALASDEQRGYELFREYGCASCHQGINIGGNMLQRFGVMRNYFDERGNLTPADVGLFAATGREEDRYVFRVPSLRNVALTAPYFHDGSAQSLEQAVGVMARFQLGRDLNDDQAGDIAAFLRTLTGELNGVPL